MVIDLITTANVAIGWYEHHSRMLRDDKFTALFDVWQDMNKKLHTQFITCPFQIEPYSATYIQLLKRSRMDSFLACVEKSQQTFDLQQVSHYGSHSAQNEGINPSPHRFSPYDKDTKKGRVSDSFCDTKKPILCLHCGYTGDHTGNCSLAQSNHPEWPISCDWKQIQQNYLCHVQHMWIMSGTFMNHGAHFCSLCGDKGHPACHFP